jgi:hypothetical protein
MKTSFTPGPWKATKDRHGAWQIDAANGSAWIAKTVPMRSLTTGMAELDTEDDARLIAAAPDLLEALQNLLIRFQRRRPGVWGESTEPVIAARAAIRKATGEAP